MNNIHGFKSLISLITFSAFISLIILSNKDVILFKLVLEKSSLIDTINKVLNLHFIALYMKENISPIVVSLFVNKIF